MFAYVANRCCVSSSKDSKKKRKKMVDARPGKRPARPSRGHQSGFYQRFAGRFENFEVKSQFAYLLACIRLFLKLSQDVVEQII